MQFGAVAHVHALPEQVLSLRVGASISCLLFPFGLLCIRHTHLVYCPLHFLLSSCLVSNYFVSCVTDRMNCAYRGLTASVVHSLADRLPARKFLPIDWAQLALTGALSDKRRNRAKGSSQ
jgi:hypothetical protein